MRAAAVAIAVLLALVLAGCDDAAPPPSAEPPTVEPPTAAAPPATTGSGGRATARVLVVTATAGFRHGSIPAAEKALREMDAAADDYELRFGTLADWPDALEDADAVAFVLTSGELESTPEARAGLTAFIERGGGFLGVHSAADTFYEFPAYQDLIGSWLRDHPYSDATLRVVADHPATAGLPPTMRVTEELYRFREDPRARGMVPLLELEDVVGAPDGEYLPSAWCSRVSGGRTLYSALGHFDATWDAPWFRDHLDGAIGWVAGTRSGGACG